MPNIELILDDCMNVMKDYEDNHFDLAIVDPPYSNDTKSLDRLLQDMKGRKAKAGVNRTDTLKNMQPNDDYWEELFRISKNQIIWGVNWYERVFGVGRVVWDKQNEKSNFSDCELAYQSFNSKTEKFVFKWNGMLQEDMKNKEVRIHPTQKPVQLYKWLLNKYAKEGQKIFDSHLGSGSIGIACYYYGVDLVGVEIDEKYYNDAKLRIDELTRQETLF